MKTCHSCGAELHEQAVLCIHCGASQEVIPVVDVVNNVNTCPYCGYGCHKDAIICVNCGKSLVRKENNVASKHQISGKGKKAISVIAIILFVSQTLANLLQIEKQIEQLTYGYMETFIPYIITVISYILILIGFIIRKNNKLPGIGFLLSVVSVGFSLVSCLADFGFVIEDGLLAAGYVLSIARNIIIATMYFSKNEAVRKIWFIPVFIVVLRCVISVFFEYFDSYYFGAADVMMIVVSYIYTLLTTIFACLNAKMNWTSSKIEEITT